MGTLIDLTGKKFGFLTVIKRADIKYIRGEDARWFCQCECGNFCVKKSSYLRKNPKISCGCKTHFYKCKGKKKQLAGKRFGKLVVLQYSHTQKKRAMWKCQCDCGNICIVKGKYLLSGDTRSCGCFKKQNTSLIKKKPIISGTKIGKLTVLYELKERRNKNIYYHCKCDCGNELDVKAAHLQRGDTRSCGCVHSFPQIEITNFFISHNINFQRQYKFDLCLSRKGRKLPFDFAVFDDNHNLKYVLQFQGQQHFKNTFYRPQEQYNEYIQHDKVKFDYCKKNNIKLIYINFDEDLDFRLNELLKQEK